MALPWFPDITPYYDRIKGIEPHRTTRLYIEQFNALDQALTGDPSYSSVTTLLKEQLLQTQQLMGNNPFVGSGTRAHSKKSKVSCAPAGEDSAREAATQLLSADHLRQVAWSDERLLASPDPAPRGDQLLEKPDAAVSPRTWAGGSICRSSSCFFWISAGACACDGATQPSAGAMPSCDAGLICRCCFRLAGCCESFQSPSTIQDQSDPIGAATGCDQPRRCGYLPSSCLK